MALTEAQKKFLRGKGHRLKPVIMVGESGISESLLREFDNTIQHHELIKIRVRAGDRRSRDATILELCNTCNAELVTRIGNVALIYRHNAERPKIQLPQA